MNEYIEIGFSSKPHGIRGALGLQQHNGESKILSRGRQLMAFPYNETSSLPASGKALTITSASAATKSVVSFAELTSRNDVEAMLPCVFKVTREAFPKLSDESEFYLVDLIDKEVFVANKSYGKIKSFYENTAQTIFTIESHEGEEIDLPYVKSFFPAVDPKGKITINLPELI